MNITSKRLFSAAAAPHSAGGKAYLPSVAFLISKHHLDAGIIASIPTSGPKNRLLKGDILAWISGKVIATAPSTNGAAATAVEMGDKELDDLLENEEFYSIDINVSNETAASNKGSLGDLVMAGALLQVKKALLTRQSLHGAWNSHIDIASKITPTILSKLSDSKTTATADSNVKGALRIVDLLPLGHLPEHPSFHISKGEAGILSITQGVSPLPQSSPSSSSSSDLTFESLLNTQKSTNEPRPLPSKQVKRGQSNDIFDFLLAPTQHSSTSNVRLELTVDSRVVKQQQARSYLYILKDAIESSPESIQSPP